MPIPTDTLTAENIEKTPPPAPKRFRVILREELTYTIDLLAKDEDEARDIALETEMKGEPECHHFDADYIIPVKQDEPDFDAVNACYRCKAVMKDFDEYPHCPSCIEAIKTERR